MAPLYQHLSLLLGLVASINAAPAALHERNDIISLGPPKFSVSFENPLPKPTGGLPTYIAPPQSKPSNQISLSPPSASVSFENPLPTAKPEPSKTSTTPKASSTPSTREPTSKSTSSSEKPPSTKDSSTWTSTTKTTAKSATKSSTSTPTPTQKPSTTPGAERPTRNDQISLGKPSASVTRY